MPLVGYVIGGFLVIPFLLPVPSVTSALLYLIGVYVLTGITHVDGVADLGDALVVHGDRFRRREVMKDTTLGTGGTLLVSLVVFGLGAGGFGLASLSEAAVVLVVSAEVGAKAAMAVLVAAGGVSHRGLGSRIATSPSSRALVPIVLVTAPAALLGWPSIGASAAAVSASLLSGGLTWYWARTRLGGISGDVLGATNEIGRVAALHVGVIAWTLS